MSCCKDTVMLLGCSRSGAANNTYKVGMDALSQCLQVLNEADLRDAVLVRTVLTRSDLGKAKIEGADFSDAVLDFAQKQVWRKAMIGGVLDSELLII